MHFLSFSNLDALLSAESDEPAHNMLPPSSSISLARLPHATSCSSVRSIACIMLITTEVRKLESCA